MNWIRSQTVYCTITIPLLDLTVWSNKQKGQYRLKYSHSHSHQSQSPENSEVRFADEMTTTRRRSSTSTAAMTNLDDTDRDDRQTSDRTTVVDRTPRRMSNDSRLWSRPQPCSLDRSDWSVSSSSRSRDGKTLPHLLIDTTNTQSN